jgi:hypothetical protein
MKAPVLIVLLVTSVLSIGSAAMLLFETHPKSAKSVKSPVDEPPEFRWGEGTEASVAPVKPQAER